MIRLFVVQEMHLDSDSLGYLKTQLVIHLSYSFELNRTWAEPGSAAGQQS